MIQKTMPRPYGNVARSTLYYKFILFIDRSNAWQFFSFKELQHSAATSRHVAYLVAITKLVYRSHRITTPYQGESAILRTFPHSRSHTLGAMLKFVHFKHTHGAVPQNGF